MAKLIDIGNNTFLNPEMIVSIDPQGSQSVVTLVTGKTVTISMDAQTLGQRERSLRTATNGWSYPTVLR